MKSETVRLKKKVETFESENEQFKKVIENKDSVVMAKHSEIKDLEMNRLKQDNSKKEMNGMRQRKQKILLKFLRMILLSSRLKQKSTVLDKSKNLRTS